MDINGKAAIVTGGTKGIGFAVAEALVKGGANVFICGRNKADLKQALEWLGKHGRAEGEVCDVRSEDQVRMLIEECERRFGGVDILVNNAGVGYMKQTVEQTTGEEFRQMLETNLFAVFYACRVAIPLMRKRGGGYIINISSLAGQYAHANMAAYNASKFGLNGFTEALMQEVRPDNIKVTAICPGSVNTYFGGDTPSDDKAWQIQPQDIGELVIDILNMPPNALASRIEVRPSKPPTK